MALKRLFNMFGAGRAPSLPDGQRIYAIGDIHGRLDLLDELLGAIGRDDAARGAADTIIISLGDLVDRGPDSAGVIDRLLTLSRTGGKTRFLLGNHEEVFLRAATGDVRAMRHFVRMGGRETIISYGVPEDEYERLDYDALTHLFAERVPQSHLDFVAGFEDWILSGDYLFVHAGIRPGVPLEEQTGGDLRWIREDFLHHRGSFGQMVVHGHTITEKVDIRFNRIGIDTGAFASGCLTALALEASERWILST